nr:PQQ-binding-like beta-propeller repeat protein [Thermococcus profundus]
MMKMFPAVLVLMLTLMLPLALAEPVQIWSYTDQCAAFSVSFNSDGYVGIAFGYDAELLSPDGKLIFKAPTRGIAYSSALSDSNVLLIGTEGSWVQAFSEPKKLLWEKKLREAVVSVSISPDGGTAVAGDASGYVYLFRNGELRWEKNIGKYVWSAVLYDGGVLAGSDTGIYAFKLDGTLLWKKSFDGAVRKVALLKKGIAVLVVPQDESWSELVLLSGNGSLVWKRHFNGYIRSISTDGMYIAAAGTTGNVTLLDSAGKLVYSTPLLSYANDVATFNGYTVVAYGKNAELIAPNGTVEWFESFNGTAYHVGFSPTGYFVVDYGSHEIDNCYSVIAAYSTAPTNGRVEDSKGESLTEPGYNPLVAGGILFGIALLGVLIWSQRKR